MSAWFQQSDILAYIDDLACPAHDSFADIYRYRASCVEHLYVCLRVCSRRFASHAFDDPSYGFDRLLTNRYTKARGGYMARFSRHWFRRYGLCECGGGIKDKMHNVVAERHLNSEQWSEECRLSLRTRLLLADLQAIRKVGIFCFSCYRYSERDLQELSVIAGETRTVKDRICYVRSYETRDDDRERMRSRSMLMGKVLLKM